MSTISEWLVWGQQHSAILSFIGSAFIALGTVTAAFVTARRYLDIYQTHVSMDFFRRFEEMSLRMPDRLRFSKLRNPLLAQPGEVGRHEWPAIARFMIEYGNLCSEEFALRQQGRLQADIWKIWREVMKENFETAIWREAWYLVAVEYVSYREFYAFMETIIAEAIAAEQCRTRG